MQARGAGWGLHEGGGETTAAAAVVTPPEPVGGSARVSPLSRPGAESVVAWLQPPRRVTSGKSPPAPEPQFAQQGVQEETSCVPFLSRVCRRRVSPAHPGGPAPGLIPRSHHGAGACLAPGFQGRRPSSRKEAEGGAGAGRR